MDELRLYIITPKDPKWGGYDTFDSAVVAAPNSIEAVRLHPSGHCDAGEGGIFPSSGGSWPNDSKLIEADFIGFAKPGTEPGLILASFNAG